MHESPSGSRVVGLPVQERERYVNISELAELTGVSVSTVKRMMRDGMPSETWGRRTRRFLPSRALAWARAQGAAGSSESSELPAGVRSRSVGP